MGKRTFDVEFHSLVTIELDDNVIKAGASDDFFSVMGFKMTPHEVASHIAYQKLFNSATLSQLDGFADLPDDNARIINEDVIGTEVNEDK